MQIEVRNKASSGPPLPGAIYHTKPRRWMLEVGSLEDLLSALTDKRVRVFQRTYPKNRFSKNPRDATTRRRFPRPVQRTWVVLEIL